MTSLSLEKNSQISEDPSNNTSHKFWDQSPSPKKSDLQVSETVSLHRLWCCYSANILQHWVGSRGLICFCKVEHSIFPEIFPGIESVSINNVRYCHNIWGSLVNKIVSYLVFKQFLESTWSTYSVLKCCCTWIMHFHKLARLGGAN